MDNLSLPGIGSGENNTDSFVGCAAAYMESSNDTVFPPALAIGSRVFQIVYGSLQVVLGTLLNTFILFLVFRFKTLRNLSFAIAVQIAAVNLMIVSTHSLPTVVNRIAGHWVLGVDFCIIAGFMAFMLSTLRTILIFILSFNRFALVFAPFFYPKISKKVVSATCVLAWLVSVAVSMPAIPPLLDCYIFSQPISSCVFSPRCGSDCSMLFNTWLGVIIVPAIITPVGFYLALWLKGRQLRHKESIMLGLAKKNTKTMSERKWKSIQTFFLLFMAVFVVTTIPVLVLNLSKLFGDVGRTLLAQIGNYIVTLLVITDPMIIMRNADVREAIGQLTKSCRRSCCKHVHREGSEDAEAESTSQGQLSQTDLCKNHAMTCKTV